VAITMSNNNCKTTVNRTGASGFTIVEMCCAMVILFIGLLATASAISYALMASNRGRTVTNSKLLVVSVLEQMAILKDTRQLTFGQIANTGQVDNTGATYQFAGFPSTPQSVSKDPGPDGIFGTADDLTSAGPDGIYGNSNDVQNDQSLVVKGYTRTITITTLSSNIKKITVTLTYAGAGGESQTMEAASYINNDAQGNYIN
jgi:type II secretory pathway pseudopilin PulG